MSPVEEVARRIQLGWINPRGMIRVTCGGEPDRRELEARLHAALPGPWLHFTFLAGAAPRGEIDRLVAAANEVPGRVLSIDGLMNADGQINKPLLDAINFRREDITRPAVRQIWWLTPALADHFVSHMPDFESWFLYRFEVKERVAERHVAPHIRTAPVVAVEVADLEQRAVIALARGQDRESVIGELILPAMTYLGQTGSGEEAWQLADRVGVAVDLKAAESPERWVAESGLMGDGLKRFARMLAATRGVASGIEMVSRVAHYLEQQLWGQASADRRAKAAAVFTALGQFQYNEWRGVQAARSCFQNAYRLRLADAALEPRNRQLQIDLASAETWLGLVAEHQRQWAEAARHYREALSIYVEFNDRHSQASTFHQLGMVAEEQRQWAEAAGHYREALGSKVEYNDRYSQASTYHHLGVVAEEQGQWAEAAGHYGEALRICVEFQDGHRRDMVLRSLSRLQRESGGDSVIALVAEVLGVPVDKARGLLAAADGPGS